MSKFLFRRLRELNEQKKIPDVEVLNAIKIAISDIQKAIKEKNNDSSLSNETKEIFEIAPLTQEFSETTIIDKAMLFEIVNAALDRSCPKLVYFIIDSIKKATDYRRIISIRDHSFSVKISQWINEFKQDEKENRSALETKEPSKDKLTSNKFHDYSKTRNTEMRLQLLAEQQQNRGEVKLQETAIPPIVKSS